MCDNQLIRIKFILFTYSYRHLNKKLFSKKDLLLFLFQILKMKLNYKLLMFTCLLVLVSTLSKLYLASKIEWSGFSPIVAIALFAGMMIKDKSVSFLLPLASLFISDVIIEVLFRCKLFPFEGLYSYQILNYSLILLTTLIGWILKGKQVNRVLGAAFIAPTLFFVLSNASVWAFASPLMYPHNLAGLFECLVAGLPFYAHSLIATIVFLPAFMVTYNFITNKTNSLLLS